jgi:hypothetical protein
MRTWPKKPKKIRGFIWIKVIEKRHDDVNYLWEKIPEVKYSNFRSKKK